MKSAKEKFISNKIKKIMDEGVRGKKVPDDEQFRFEQAQVDVQAGLISPVDYVRIAKYDDPKEIAKNNVIYKQNPAEAVGIAPEKKPILEVNDQFARWKVLAGIKNN